MKADVGLLRVVGQVPGPGSSRGVIVFPEADLVAYLGRRLGNDEYLPCVLWWRAIRTASAGSLGPLRCLRHLVLLRRLVYKAFASSYKSVYKAGGHPCSIL